MPLRSLLVISAAPDDRPSTATLTAMVDELRRRPHLRTRLWFLRAGDPHVTHPLLGAADRVVDELRTIFPLPLLDKVGAGVVSGAVRGRVLQRWWAELDPDVVLLDDGLGARLVPEGAARVVVRRNESLPADTALEGEPAGRADGWILSPEAPAEAHPALVVPQVLRDHPRAVAYQQDRVRRTARSKLGLDPDVPLVVGWGEDPWLDAPDVFVRSLWYLRERHGVDAHGLWMGLADRGTDVEHLRDEAERCGLADRVHLREAVTPEGRLCGDVTLLPYRSTATAPELIRESLVSGTSVVTSPDSGLSGVGVEVVPPLDAAAAGEALARCLAADRGTVAARHMRAEDVRPWVDDLVAFLDEVVDG